MDKNLSRKYFMDWASTLTTASDTGNSAKISYVLHSAELHLSIIIYTMGRGFTPRF